MRKAVGRLAEYPEAGCRVVTVDRRAIGIWRSGARLYAVRDVCPHQGAQLSLGRLGGTMLPSEPGEYRYGMDGEVITCPWHGFEYSAVTGEMLFGTGKLRVATYPVWVEDGMVYLDPDRARAADRPPPQPAPGTPPPCGGETFMRRRGDDD